MSARRVLLAALPVVAAAITVGGIFTGAAPRLVTAVAGLLGLAIAVGVTRIGSAAMQNVAAAAGIFAAGLLLVLPSGASNVTRIAARIAEAAASGEVLRPPVPFTPGWRALASWLVCGVGFASGWSVLVAGRTALAIALPLPVVAFAAISVPDGQKAPTAVAVFALYAVALSLVSGERDGGSRAYELRRTARAVVLLGAITGVLAAISATGVLFPRPLINPTLEPQKPKAVPLSEVTDRVLFRVRSSVSGPWRMGLLDVYDGIDWRLPPFAETDLREIPSTGVIDAALQPGVSAAFTIEELGGAVLPGLPNLVGLIGRGELAYDARTGNIRVTQGIVERGTAYTVTAARVPSVDELRAAPPPPPDLARFTRMPDPPPAVRALLDEAPAAPAWDRLDFVRRRVLDTVVATGPGTPVSVPPARVDDVLAGSREASPFEIVAAQAMLARWAGIPARIGFGFDGGDLVGRDTFEVRPKHGATFLEVHFTGSGWLPVLGAPRQAKSTTSEGEQRLDPNVLPSEDIAIVLYLPQATPRASVLASNVRRVALAIVALVLLAACVRTLAPLPRKAIRRARLRSWAADSGVAARIAVAYAEWRDHAADLGYVFAADTPLMFVRRTVPDREHETFAWLVTRALWGDLRTDLRDEDAANAEELSRALRRRLSLAHPWTLRAVAALSRTSLREPYGLRVPAGDGARAAA